MEQQVIHSNKYDDSKYLIMDTIDVIIDGDNKGNTLEMATLIAEQYIVFCAPKEDVIVVSSEYAGVMEYLVQLDKDDTDRALVVENEREFLEYLNAVNVDLF